MRQKILVTAAVLTLAVGTTTSAIAFSHKAGHAGRHARNYHTVRNAESWRPGDTSYRGGFIDLGPLGITAACGSYRSKHYCSQGYSVSAWSY
jgi:hypothetical protein